MVSGPYVVVIVTESERSLPRTVEPSERDRRIRGGGSLACVNDPASNTSTIRDVRIMVAFLWRVCTMRLCPFEQAIAVVEMVRAINDRFSVRCVHVLPVVGARHEIRVEREIMVGATRL